MVVLRRLADALADGDPIRAVILGSAINNDGAQKVGFTAPSVEGQAEVVEEALAMAGVDPETVGYVEAHGSGTELGDPVEVAALTQAFGHAPRTEYCALGSVKTNIGHLDAAAGVAGLDQGGPRPGARRGPAHASTSPSPNPQIDFAGSPFFVNTELRPWPGGGATPRRAGVSSLGIGGTNAHVVLEEAPAAARPPPPRARGSCSRSRPAPRPRWRRPPTGWRRTCAPTRSRRWPTSPGRCRRGARRSRTAARWWRATARRRRARWRRAPPGSLFDAAAPEGAQRGRLPLPRPGRTTTRGWGSGLYETEPLFRETVDRCAEILRPYLGMDLREALYPADARRRRPDGPGGLDLRAHAGRAPAGRRDRAAGRAPGWPSRRSS